MVAEHSTIERDGTRIAFQVSGAGPDLVLGHSFLCDGAMWRYQTPALARNHRVINIDARGHGASGPFTGPCTLYDMTEDALAVLDHLGVGRAIWAGLSLGGMVALRAALTNPERVAALLLLDTDAGSESPLLRFKYTMLAWIVRAFGMRAVTGQVQQQMFGPTTRRQQPDLVAEWTTDLLAQDVPSLLRVNQALAARDDLVGRLDQVTVPALVLVGEEDSSTPPARAQRIADALPRARLVSIARAGHLSTLEQPEAVMAAMLAFLENLNDID